MREMPNPLASGWRGGGCRACFIWMDFDPCLAARIPQSRVHRSRIWSGVNGRTRLVYGVVHVWVASSLLSVGPTCSAEVAHCRLRYAKRSRDSDAVRATGEATGRSREARSSRAPRRAPGAGRAGGRHDRAVRVARCEAARRASRRARAARAPGAAHVVRDTVDFSYVSSLRD
jgi:hypothetical protein